MARIAPNVAVSPEVAQLAESVIDLRRTLHRWPELGFQEERTSALVAERLQALGLEVRTGIAQTGVLGILRGKGKARRCCCGLIWTAYQLRKRVAPRTPPSIMASCMPAGTMAIRRSC